ncbi:MAG: hypothetical protein GWM98_15405 [Nitrospinaceae bacterium]|nr:hypothetical protein [Nitrospinaceae bacterium]NIR55611.1 hypothetical protein [Nitrospinaceae bacterium]NIS86045.1 hypothetical protein [Nitrospinaceae bacterium]NIT82888.1 hypothetical protein [Nitrospinaceae bacterium]NIU45093.1 hypothetical protein [Nitrospinaceae bacterium]
MTNSVFKPVTLEWEGTEYEIPADRIMGLIVRLEDIVSFRDLDQKNVKPGKISAAYAEALRYAGATVTDEEVYEQMFLGATTGQLYGAIAGLFSIMIPPSHLQKKTKDGPEPPGAPKKGKRHKAG